MFLAMLALKFGNSFVMGETEEREEEVTVSWSFMHFLKSEYDMDSF